MFAYYNIMVFGVFCVGANSDWVEIPQMQETMEKKTTSITRQYAFPRNEYVYQQPPKINDRFPHTPNPPTSTTAPPKEMSSKTTKSTLTLESNQKPATYPKDNPLIQKRMDNAEEINSEKLVGTTEAFPEETVENVDGSDDPMRGAASFIPFLRSVQDEIIVKGHKNLKGKIDMLKNLRNDLLLNIDERISKLWGGEREYSNEAREHKEEDYDMHFPSNEGALMTIGFLTFAVFLIKLVLKLVQTLKYKHSMVMVTPTMMTTNAALIGRRKRDVVFDEHKRILKLIEENRFT
ncbi:uncharacterized protein LOC123307998 [Coccinella septempunctata]|uniref:uncharacterized protein LOC123307998 n=1 Tax=Coccinella septempunctata TaxID=41139 RepID=UPI001D07B9D5|nr:uncharacterized protein LOC123307998 [Coccinella septempunctata]